GGAAAASLLALDAAARHPVSPRTPATLRAAVTARALAAGWRRRRRAVVGEWGAVMGIDHPCRSSGRPWSAQGDRPGDGARQMATELEFRAMGSDVHVIVVGGAVGLAEAAQHRIDELEQKWCRFLPDSAVSELNRLAG